MRVGILAAVVVLGIAVAAPADAAPWRPVTAADGASIDQVSVLRTPDVELHVAWRHRSGPNTEDLLHTRIAPDGTVGATTPIQSGWAGILDPALTRDPAGIRAFWSGFRTTDSNDPNREVSTALSTDGGGAWALMAGSVVPGGGQSYGSDITATTLADGSSLQAWAGTLGTWVHAGLSPDTPIVDYQAAHGQYGNFPGLAADASGRAMMAWFSSAESLRGVLAQAVGPDAQPAGPPQRMPGSEVMVGGGTVSRTPIAARAGTGGFYVTYALGYPNPSQVRLWQVGSTQATLIARAAGSPETTVAADSAGRLWVVWSDGTFGEKRVLARRSNRTATRFGAVVNAGAPPDAHSVYSVDASATDDALDVLALVGRGTSSDGSTYVTRVLPGLTLKARPGRLGRRAREVTFTVTDAGDPVQGATVRANGRSGRTNSRGTTKLTLRNSAVARATLAGYTPASRRLR